MKVEIWPAGDMDDATTQYRLIMPAQALLSQGADIVWNPGGPTCAWSREWDPAMIDPPADVELKAVADPHCDVVVMQRPGRMWWALIIPFLQEHGVKVVVDVDDRFDQIAKTNKAYQAYDPRGQSGFGYNKNLVHNWHWIAQACKRADVVTATTPALVKQFGYGHGVVVPNLVPKRYLSISGSRPGTIGWSGAVDTHPEDLQVAASAVSTVLDASAWRFHVVGPPRGVSAALGLSEEPSSTEGWIPFQQYIHELAKMEIGIVPLADTAFNESKSCLKMMEMAAVGVPCVGSPTYDNRRLHELGVGLLAATPQKWRKNLMSLIRNPEYRADLAGRGKEVMKSLTYEAKADRWWSAWTGERKVRRAATAA